MPEDRKEDIREGETPEDGDFSREEKLIDDALVKQIKNEYTASETFKAPYRKKWIRQMKMMNNEKKLKEKIGDETMYTIFDTLYSALTSDRLMHNCIPTEMGDIEKAELIEAMMENDFRKMEMQDIDDYWTWWTLFTGHAVLDLSEFDEEILCISPEWINPFLDYPDPKALSIHGIGKKRKGSARFYGYIIETTVSDLEEAGFDIESFDTTVATAQKDLNNMNKYLPDTLKTGDNEERSMVVWYTRYNKQWYQVFLDTGINAVIRKRAIKKPTLSDRLCGISPVGWYPRTPPDFLEDKHKAKANTMNLAMDNVREQQKSIYLTTTGNIRLDSLAEAQGGDILEVKDINKIKPMEKASITNDVEWLLQKLDGGAQEVSATPDIQQGVVMDQKRTLGELSLVASGSKNRYGMKARIFSRSMRIFWNIWYEQLHEYWNERVHNKVIQIAGVYGPEWRTIRKPDITLSGNFDISITSKLISDADDAIARTNFFEWHKIASTDPSYQIREGIKEIGRRSGLKTQQLNFFMKKSVDEKEAEKENILLEENKLTDGKDAVMFHIMQDHEAHIREHMKCKTQGKAWKAHIEQHYEADIFLKNNPDMKAFLKSSPSDMEIARDNTNDKSIGQSISPQNYTPGALPTL